MNLNNFTILPCCVSLLRKKGRGETTLNFPFLFVFLSLSWLWKFLVETIFAGKSAHGALCLHAVEKEVVCCSSSSCFSNIPFIIMTKKDNAQRRKSAISWKKAQEIVIMHSITRFQKQCVANSFCDLSCELFFVCC